MLELLKIYMPRVKALLFGVLVFEVLQAIFTLLLPRVTADIIDKGVVQNDSGAIWSIGGWMMLIAISQGLALVAGIYFAARASMAAGREIRQDLFHKVTGFSSQEMGHFGAPTLITRITNDVQQIQAMIHMACTMAVMAPITGVFGTYMAIREDASLSIVLLISIPLFALVAGTLMGKAHPIFTLMQDRIDDVNTVLREQITGIRVVRAFVREPAEEKRFATANQALTDTGFRTGRIMAVLFPAVMLVQNGASVAIIWYGALRIDAGEMSIGSLVAFLGYIVMVLMAVMMSSFMFVMLPRAAVSGNRIMEALRAEASVTNPSHARSDVGHRGALELREVTFGYPGAEEPVIRSVSFTTRPGETTAIIGSTGSGKTTLLNLVPRLFDVTGGAILIDDTNIRELDLDDLWARIGLIPQRPFLFSGTIADNLRYGKEDATEEEIWEALTVAQGADFVAAMPEGIYSQITQGGTNVSGGQRQRLAIARALIRKPDIYLFDDSFSALDLTTDANLRAALVPYTANAITILVAQRVSTIVNADQIVVLEEGSVVGLGTHDELLATCPTYVEIVDSQMSVEAKS